MALIPPASRGGLMTGLLLPLALAVAGPALGAPPPPAPPDDPGGGTLLEGVFILMESDGLPGEPHAASAEDEGPSRQELLVTRDRLRLLDSRSGSTYLFRLDQSPPAIWEILPGQDAYRDARRHEEIQTARDRFERDLIRAQTEELAGPELERWLERNHLKADGSREVTMETEDRSEPVLGHAVKRYVVKENGRVIVEALVTEDLKITIPYFDFYRRIGAFSNEVLEQLRQIDGVPLQATFTVVTDLLNHEIRTRVTDISRQTLQTSFFELPPGAEKVEPTPPEVPCARAGCKEIVETEAPGDKIIVQGRPHHFCGRDCKKMWLADYRARLREKTRGGG